MEVKTCQSQEVISKTAWIELSLAMQEEKTILNTRTSPENLEKAYLNGLAIAIFVSGHIVAFISAWPVAEGFIEFGSAWVHKDMRGYGLGRRLYMEAKQLPGLNDKTCFAVTQNPIALMVGLHANLVQHENWEYPVPWELTCGPCDLLPNTEKPSCPKRNVTCWHRIMR
jgi:GNAT superfamily N-acetyltransferase